MKNNKLKIKSKIFSLFIFEILFIIFYLSSVKVSLAQELSVGVNPPIIQIEAESPANIKAPITLENLSDQNITYGIFLRPFTPGSDKNGEPSYDPALIEEYRDFFSKVQISDGQREITEIELSGRQKKELTLKINIPKEETPADYYFTVVFLSQADEQSEENSFVGARGGIGTNVLLSIGPKSQPIGNITNFSVPKFVTHGPVGFTLELANHNDFYVTSTGNLIIKNIFNQPVGNIEFGPKNILANSTRLISNSDDETDPKLYWNEKFLLGIYKADVNVALSDKGPLIRRSIVFFAFPAEVVFGLIAILIIFIALIRRARKKSLDDE